MLALIQGIYQIAGYAQTFIAFLADFGHEHLAPLISIFYDCYDNNIDVLSVELVGYAGTCFACMLIRFLWNALRGAGA